MSVLQQLEKQLRALGDTERAQHAQGYFKSAEGEYGAGDRFLGIRVPELRRLARQYRRLDYADVLQLLVSPWHEARLLALFILIEQFQRADAPQRKRIYLDYLKHTDFINNWDLVDSSAPKIVGVWLNDKDHKPLYKLARSASLWERRIAVLSCFYFIQQHKFNTALEIAGVLVHDKHNLIHKAVGWMLREIGKRDQKVEESFLQQHYKTMPRTMLRYAIERFPTPLRQAYLSGTI